LRKIETGGVVCCLMLLVVFNVCLFFSFSFSLSSASFPLSKKTGASKVSKARARATCDLISLHQLKEGLVNNALEDLGSGPPMLIQNFSAGYYGRGGGNAIALTDQALRVAQGFGGSDLLESIEQGGSTGNAVLDEDIRKKKRIKNRKPKKKKAATKKMKKSSSSSSSSSVKEEDAVMAITLTCDGCGVDCTSASYFIPSTEEDYCQKCLSKKKAAVAQPQRNGIDVTDATAANQMMALVVVAPSKKRKQITGPKSSKGKGKRKKVKI
jgi:hypothetical protein